MEHEEENWIRRHRSLVRWGGDLALFAFALFHGFAVLRDPGDLATAATVLGALGIFFRREVPVVSLLVGLPGLVFGDAIVAPVVALYSLGTKYADRRILIPAVVVVVLGYSAFWRHWESLTHATLLITYSVAVSVGALAVGILVRTRRELGTSLGALGAAQAELIDQAEVRARAQERARLAREMHDVVAHQVTLIAVESGALTVTANDPDVVRAGSVIRNLAVRTIEELRQLLHILRSAGAGPADLEPPASLDDIPALVARSGLDVSLVLDAPGELPSALQRAAYRTVQEGLTNAGRYAPDAEILVASRVVDGVFTLSVENGPSSEPGPDLPTTHQGHLGLAERASLLGGSFDAGPTGDGGYGIRLRVGLEQASRSSAPVNGRSA